MKNSDPIEYAIKIIYIGDDSMLPGEPLITYFKFKTSTNFNFTNPYRDAFCIQDQPSTFKDKKDAIYTCKQTQRRLNAIRHDPDLQIFSSSAHFAKMEFFCRVVEWNKDDFKNSDEERLKISKYSPMQNTRIKNGLSSSKRRNR